MKRLENKVAIITGAAMGQGAAEAYLFAKEGAKVVAADMAEDALKETVDAINADFPGMALGVHLDVASEENWQQVVKQAVETFGTVDILVNNAGVGSRGINYDKTDREAFDRIVSSLIRIFSLQLDHLGQEFSQHSAVHLRQGQRRHVCDVSAMQSCSEPSLYVGS